MAETPRVTRTFGPVHFEDLDAHRFEDLIRELIYEFKDWQRIEATGRSGSDDGFDIRAFEKQGLKFPKRSKTKMRVSLILLSEGL